jgi:hypothetical protein
MPPDEHGTQKRAIVFLLSEDAMAHLADAKRGSFQVNGPPIKYACLIEGRGNVMFASVDICDCIDLIHDADRGSS